MATLSEAMKRVSRLVDDELRRADEIARLAEDIGSCEDLLARKAECEDRVRRWAEEGPQLAARAEEARARLPSPAALREAADKAGAACRRLAEIKSLAGGGLHAFLDRAQWDAGLAVMGLNEQSGETIVPVLLRLFADNEKLAQAGRAFAAQRGALALLRQEAEKMKGPQGTETPLGQEMLFADVTVGYKTTREFGYPLIFLTQKVRRPVIEHRALPPAEQARVIAEMLQAIDDLTTELPRLLQARDAVAENIGAIEECEQARRQAEHAARELAQLPEGVAAAAQDCLRRLQARRAALQGPRPA